MHADKKRFIDSINFVNAPLSTFPKTFGLKELKKGIFRICLIFLLTKIT